MFSHTCRSPQVELNCQGLWWGWIDLSVWFTRLPHEEITKERKVPFFFSIREPGLVHYRVIH